jgi:HAD superfamily hydrolase (TIGR01548 family)
LTSPSGRNKPKRNTRSSDSKSKSGKRHPQIIIFDVDGVLVDVRGSFHRSTLQTVRFFTGKRVTLGELQQWKSRSGYNDDWVLSTAWVKSLGGKAEYPEVKQKFIEYYWGVDAPGNVAREKWLLPKPVMTKLAKKSELALFTGRTRKELDYTLDLLKVRKFFKTIVTVEDVTKPKPAPEGLIRILNGRAPESALYVGDSVDDALASRAAKIPFVGVLFGRGEVGRERRKLLQELGAVAVINDVADLLPVIKRNGLFT